MQYLLKIKRITEVLFLTNYTFVTVTLLFTMFIYYVYLLCIF